MNGNIYKKSMDQMKKIKEIVRIKINKIKMKTIGNYHLKKTQKFMNKIMSKKLML